jgi:hypothetical protein
MAQAQDHKARKLTTHQKAVLIQVLRTFPDERVEIRCAPGANDALSYAQDFLSIFRAIGWEVVDRPEAGTIATDSLSGIALLVSEGKLPACAEALRDALRIYEVELATHTHAADAANTFTLWIGQGSDSHG